MRRDIGVAETFRDALPDVLVDVFQLLTHLGDWRFAIVALGVLVAADLYCGVASASDADDPILSPQILTIVATVFGTVALVITLEGVIDAPQAGLTPSEPQTETGFPSGHTTVATVFWGSLATWLSVGHRRLRVTATVAIVTVVALSRLALGAHYAVDVVAGVVLGAGYIAVVLALDSRPERAFGLALVCATVAAILVGTDRAFLSAAGTFGSIVGWRLLEFPPVRTRLRSGVATIR